MAASDGRAYEMCSHRVDSRVKSEKEWVMSCMVVAGGARSVWLGEAPTRRPSPSRRWQVVSRCRHGDMDPRPHAVVLPLTAGPHYLNYECNLVIPRHVFEAIRTPVLGRRDGSQEVGQWLLGVSSRELKS